MLNTPQLLKLYGIGPKAELSALKIPVVVDPPGVGTNIQDHYEVTISGTFTTNLPFSNGCTLPQTIDDPCYAQWTNNNTGHGIYLTNGVALGSLFNDSISTQSDVFVGALPANFHVCSHRPSPRAICAK